MKGRLIASPVDAVVRQRRLRRYSADKIAQCFKVEASWYLIGKDQAMKKTYEQIKARAGAKRAIVAIARKLLLSTRRMLLDKQPWRQELAAAV